MSYRITQFGTVILPELDPEDDVSTFEARNSLVTLSSGWFDARGSERSLRNPLVLRVRRALIATEAQVTHRTAFNGLRALVGTRAKLYRTWEQDGQQDATVEWTYARLLQVGGRADRKDNRNMADVDLAFQIISPTWYGATEYSIDVSGAGAPDWSFTLNNSGNAIVTEAVIMLAQILAAPTLTYFRLENTTTGHMFEWNGALGASSDLIIDCGAQTIQVNGVDDYDGFIRPTNRERWMEFAPGANAMEVSTTGGDEFTHLDTTFYPPWE